ncbi:MAG: hypothetical protein EBV07_00065 [Proteobacteria bacterium]|nr:hypothetical protein [Pseudomonadota bacterium]
MLGEIKYEKYGNLSIFRKKGIGLFSTRSYTEYTKEVVRNLIFKFKDDFVFYFTYDFYLRTGIYQLQNLIYQKVIVLDKAFYNENLAKKSNSQIVIEEYSTNKRINYLIKDLVILNFVSKIVILEATKFSSNLKILAEVASENSVDVFCLPGRLFDRSSYGTNKIIYDGGIPLFDFELLNS